MSHRYLPWVRRGLAGAIEAPDNPDDPIADIPGLATFSVGIDVNGQQTTRQIMVHGPASATGIDPRAIVRHDPERFVADFEPNNLVSLEFDRPDFPWMFTPARASAQDRLRPWLVLVVVEQQEGVSVRVPAGTPGPVLTITGPASPARELPPLNESWAWAHSQVITENNTAADITDEILNGHDLNLSRLICPRRLVGNRRYLACLVPAFEAGRRAGLGLPSPPTLDLYPAWRPNPDGPPDHPIEGLDPAGTVNLPVYYHWEFGTSYGGSDFEVLVDRIEPVELDDGAGSVPMYVGDPGQGIPTLPADDSILGLEGALRPIGGGPDPSLDDVPAALRDELQDRLNAPAEHLANGTPSGATPVAPPIYGSFHTRTHEITPGTGPAWLEELNLDPRLRTIAGIGASIVRDHQEELMDEAWAQVGDVLTANQLLNQAALSKEAGARAFDRHLVPLDDEQVFTITAPTHRRTRGADGGTIRSELEQSRIPDAITDPALRRMTSPQNRVRKRASRRAGTGGDENGSVADRLLADLESGAVQLTDLQSVPDALAEMQAVAELDLSGPEVDLSPIGGVGTVPTWLVQMAADRYQGPLGVDQPLAPRSDLDQSGVVSEELLEQAAAMMGGVKKSLINEIGQAIAALRPTSSTAGLRFVLDGDQVVPELVDRLEPTDPTDPKDPTDPRRTTKEDSSTTEEGGDLPDDVFPLPGRDGPLVAELGQEIVRFGQTFEPDRPTADPIPLDVGGKRPRILEANDPRATTVRRVEHMIERSNWPFDEPLDPIMVAPRFDTSLHQVLTAKSKELFLPGLSRLLPNSITLAETNSRFVEAFLVGANHEMNHELFWRQYPTDRRGTPFKRFWDRLDGLDDIDDIHRWHGGPPIGSHMIGGANGWVVLLVRADLLRHFPNTIIYAAPADGNGDLDLSGRIDPVMVGQLEPDITFVMLPITSSGLLSGDGHYIVFEEQSTELQLGLDLEIPGQTPPALTTWNDLSWGHVQVAPGEHLVLANNPLDGEDLNDPADDAPVFGRTSADLAAILLQRPVMVAFHAQAMIGDLL